MTSSGSEIRERNLVALPPIDSSKYSRWDPGRFDSIYLYDADPCAFPNNLYLDSEKSPSNHSGAIRESEYRYLLRIIDRNDLPKNVTTSTAASIIPVAVFLVPAGREREYIFSSYRGLLSVAQSASCARLIAVTFHRNHEYSSQEMVQAELTFTVQVLAQRGSFLKKSLGTNFSSIPFMAIDGIGNRNVIAEGESTTTGPYFIEEVELDAPTSANHQKVRVRRLYFRQNENVIQTQVFMKNNMGHQSEEDVIDEWALAFEYHKQIAMGLVAIGERSTLILPHDTKEKNITSTTTGMSQDNDLKQYSVTSFQGLVIGLGGGGLLNFLKVFLPYISWTVIELDQDIVQIAKRYFGFQEEEGRMKVCIGDGLSISVPTSQESDNQYNGKHENLVFNASSISFLIIDVDSKDVTVGMSCPPVAFVSVEYLTRLHGLLTIHGVLALNISARDPAMMKMVLKNTREVFHSAVYVATSSEDDDNDALNIVVFCKKMEGTDHETTMNCLLPSTTESMERLREICESNHLSNSKLLEDWEDCIVGIQPLSSSQLFDDAPDPDSWIEMMEEKKGDQSKVGLAQNKKKKKKGKKK